MHRASALLQFGPAGRFELQPLQRRLMVDGQPAALGARAFDLLLELAARPGALRSRNELIDAVWPGVIVEDGNLATQISALRKVLGSEIIATIPGRGYRFAASIDESGGAPVLARPATPATPSTPEAPPLRTNLPADLLPLLGRADDLVALGELVAQRRLVTVVGAGGMGKTRLVQTFLHGRQQAYPHGVCWVELATVTETEALPGAIAAALGVRLGEGEAVSALARAVAPLTLLLALDNAEHLLDGTARVVQAMLDAAPGLRLVVTSQAPLKLAAEYSYRLGALAVPPAPLPAAQALAFGAVALFAERARQADHRFALGDAGVPAVIELCRQLDGLALAIELAAARAPMFGVPQLLASLQDRLKLLTGSRNRTAPARQQTLRAALEWSHGFLDETERAVFRRLAVFAGSGSLAMVQQVFADDAIDGWTVLDALALLVDRSLVTVLDADAGAGPRYRLLETPRLYALERLREAGEEDCLRRRHMLAVAERFDAAWHKRFDGSVGIQAWAAGLSADVDNARQALAAALAAGETRVALQLAATLLFALPKALHAERQQICDRCEPLLADEASAGLRVRMGIVIAVHFGNTDRGRAMMVARLAVADALDLPDDAQGRWMRYVANAQLTDTASRSQALETAREALAQVRRLEDPSWPPHRRLWRGEAEYAVARTADDPALALRLVRLQAGLRGAAGESSVAGHANIIDVELAAGDAAAAARTGAALVAALEGGRDPYALAFVQLNLGAARLALHDTFGAREALEPGWGPAVAFGMQSFFSDYLALLAALESHPRAAARLAGYADACNASVGPRQSNEEAAIRRAEGLARAALGDAAFDRLRAEGAGLQDAEVGALAFAHEDLG